MTVIFACVPPFVRVFLMDPVPVVVLVLAVFRDLVSLVSSDISVPVVDSFVSAMLNVYFSKLWGHVETKKNYWHESYGQDELTYAEHDAIRACHE